MNDADGTAGLPQRPRIVDRVTAVGVACIAIVWGAFHASRSAFWLDEAFTAVAARQRWSQLIHFLGHEAGMGPYYITLWGWARFGTSEGWLRVWSVIGGAVALAATYLFTVRRVDRRVALIACVLMFTNPAFMYYLVELRAYSWVMAMAVITTALFLRFRERPSTWRAVWWGASVGLMLGMLVFTVGLVLVQAAFSWPLLRERAARWRVLLAGGVAGVLFAPFLPALMSSNQLHWIPAMTWQSFQVDTAGALGTTPWAIALLAGNGLLAISFLVPRLRRRDDIAMHLIVCALPTIPAVLALMSLHESVFLSRYLLTMLPLAMIGAAAGYYRMAMAIPWTAPWSHIATAGVLAVTLLCLERGLDANLERPEDLRGVAKLLNAQVHADDAIVFNALQVEESMEYYWTPDSPVFAEDTPGRTFEAAGTTYCHVWYVFRSGPSRLLEYLHRSARDSNVTVETFVGYSVAEVEYCPRPVS